MVEKLKLWYTIRGLAQELAIDHQKLARILKKGFKEKNEPVLRNGRLWLCDIKRIMPEFYESWTERVHQQSLSRRASVDDDE